MQTFGSSFILPLYFLLLVSQSYQETITLAFKTCIHVSSGKQLSFIVNNEPVQCVIFNIERENLGSFSFGTEIGFLKGDVVYKETAGQMGSFIKANDAAIANELEDSEGSPFKIQVSNTKSNTQLSIMCTAAYLDSMSVEFRRLIL